MANRHIRVQIGSVTKTTETNELSIFDTLNTALEAINSVNGEIIDIKHVHNTTPMGGSDVYDIFFKSTKRP